MAWILKFFLAGPYFVFVSGGSASGKTTFANELVERLGEKKAVSISLDEYLDKAVQPEKDYIDGIPNFDNPSMINWKLLKENILLLQNGKSIQTPNYDFHTWGPSGARELEWRPIVIIEGIHAVSDHLDSIPGLRVFLDVPEEVRYKRRVKRDVEERKYSIELIEKIFYKMAVPFQKIFIDPMRHKADVILENNDAKAADRVVQLLEQRKKNDP